MSRITRKIEHIEQALKTGQSGAHGFDDVQFVHHSLPDINKQDVTLGTSIGELNMSSPIMINAMTGGGSKQTYDINRSLAIVAREKNLAMAVGSQMAALKDAHQTYTYRVVRDENPQGTILANLGSEATVDQVLRVVDMLEADAMQIHLNVIQELVMPEGDRQFSGTLQRIEQIAKRISVPLIVKEVGFGINGSVAKQLASVGVTAIDVAGFGGTNFAAIENQRREYMYEAFNHWGITTVCSLVEVSHSVDVDVIASGGISSPLDMMKSLTLGAKAVAMAGFFLKHVQHGQLEIILDMVDLYHDQLQTMMCALGVRKIEEAGKVPVVLHGESFHWLEQRGYSTQQLAQRDRCEG